MLLGPGLLYAAQKRTAVTQDLQPTSPTQTTLIHITICRRLSLPLKPNTNNLNVCCSWDRDSQWGTCAQPRAVPTGHHVDARAHTDQCLASLLLFLLSPCKDMLLELTGSQAQYADATTNKRTVVKQPSLADLCHDDRLALNVSATVCRDASRVLNPEASASFITGVPQAYISVVWGMGDSSPSWN